MGTIFGGGGLLVTTPASAAALLHQGLRPVAFSSQAILFHMMSSQLLPTMPPVSWEFWFQHLRGCWIESVCVCVWGGGGAGWCRWSEKMKERK